MERTILHCDLNNFYASVECKRHPELRGHAVAVCGNSEERHGIVLAKNEEAKRFGVTTGEAIWQAQRKCPGLVLVAPHMEQYVAHSKMAYEIYCRYTDRVEPFGIDECWLDVSGSLALFGSGYTIAQRIRNEIKNELEITVSVGVSFNKVFAKLGSDLKKPDDVTQIASGDFREKIFGLPAAELLGVGPATARKLDSYGIFCIGELAGTDPNILERLFGKNGRVLWHFANGRDASEVAYAGYQAPVKSVGHGITCTKDLTKSDEARRVFLSLSQDVARRLRKNGLAATSVQIGVKDSTLFVREYQAPLAFATQSSRELTAAACALFDKKYRWDKDVRALTLRAIGLVGDDAAQQTNLFIDCARLARQERMERTVDALRERFGRRSVMAASLFLDCAIPVGKPVENVLPTMRI